MGLFCMDFVVKPFNDFIHVGSPPVTAGKGAAGIFKLIPGFVIRKILAAVVFFVRIKIIVNMHRINIVALHQISDDPGDMVLYHFIRRIHPVHAVFQPVGALGHFRGHAR